MEPALGASRKPVLLKTATLVISGSKGAAKVLCLFDGGAQRSFIRQGLAELIGARHVGSESLRVKAFGTDEEREKSRPLFQVELKGTQRNATPQGVQLIGERHITTVGPYEKTALASK